MDIIKFNSPRSAPFVPTNLQNAEAISGYTSASWIERYREPGEFKIEAKLSSRLKERLPIGSYISHLNTFEVMVVEDHEIVDKESGDPMITITGRSLEVVLLESRVIGTSLPYQSNLQTGVGTLRYSDYTPYVLPSDALAVQIQRMLRQHVGDLVLEVDDRILNIAIDYDIRNAVAPVERIIDRGSVQVKMIELLKSADYGIRVIRQHAFPGSTAPNTVLRIHDGKDLSNQVIFSADNGELTEAQYLWSSRNFKNSVLVTGQYLECFYEEDYASINDRRKTMFMFASDLDRDYEPGISSNAVKTAILQSMEQRGKEALAAQRETALVSATVISLPNPNYAYRVSYDIGDIVLIRGNYGESAPMRVIEYAEFEDDDKSIGYPTLSKI